MRRKAKKELSSANFCCDLFAFLRRSKEFFKEREMAQAQLDGNRSAKTIENEDEDEGFGPQLIKKLEVNFISLLLPFALYVDVPFVTWTIQFWTSN